MGWRNEINEEYTQDKLDELEDIINNLNIENKRLNDFIKKSGILKKESIPDSYYIGKTYGKLTILRFTGTNKHRHRLVEVKCSCEEETIFIVGLYSLKNGNTKTCGCGSKAYNTYDLTGEHGIGYDSKGRDFYFDIEDYDLIKDTTWIVNANKRVSGVFKDKSISFHKLITNTSSIETVDHINLNPSDNRKENLRIVTPQQNAFNRRGHGKLSKFGVKGISWFKSTKKWIGHLSFNRKTVYSEYFENILDAIQPQIEAEKLYFGEHRYMWENEIKWDELLAYEKEVKNNT